MRIGMKAIMFSSVLQMCIILFMAIGAYAEKSIAVLNLKSEQLKPGDCIAVTNYITSELRKAPGYRIIAWDDVTKMLEHRLANRRWGATMKNASPRSAAHSGWIIS